MSQVLVVSKKGALVPKASAFISKAAPRRRRQNKLQKSSNAQSSSAIAYARTLQNPFECGPIKLGFNTMVPTVLGSAYARGFQTVNADGSFGLIMFPDALNYVGFNTAGSGIATWTLGPSVNQAGLVTQMNQARIVSMRIRCFCLFPETSASGVLFGGQLIGESRTSSFALNINTLSSLPGSQLGIGTKGAMSVGLPVDALATQFNPEVVNGVAAGEAPAWSFPYIVGRGFPAGTIVWYETAMNLEGTASNNFSTIGTDPSANSSQDPTRQHSNFESFFNAARNMVKSPVVMDAAEGVANLYLPGAGNVIHSVRRAFGHGHAQLVAGRSVNAQQHQASRVIIEEM